MNFTAEEYRERRRKFTRAMNSRCPRWETAILIDNVNQFYFTGTMQDGILFIRRDASCPGGSRLLYGVRRSFARAKMESPLFTDPSEQSAESAPVEEIIPMASYRDIAEKFTGAFRLSGEPGGVYIEGDTMPVVVLERLRKYFPMPSPAFLDAVIRTVRSVKSEAELELIRLSGERHRILLEERVPALLREGMSEAEFLGAIAVEMYRLGYQGLARFHQAQTEIAIGQIGFGINSLYPSRFDGPGGMKGGGAAVPLGAGETMLKKGDAVFVDIAFGMKGYHTDKTQVYFFGAEPPGEFKKAHQLCIEIQKRAAERLVPGEIPSKIYRDITASLGESELDCFMGVDNSHRVKFLGHGTGLNVDDFPVIAKGFDEPLEENMVIALEPKKGVRHIGLSGVEDTYIVKTDGARCVTGGGRDIIRV
ncbi:MAG: Xaa-Pro peptidase family protein [Treponema sp.]|jgi:Xaa-Pro aminopeptidase|nr:Xaa-Pro peptidase family protein [Treponema sp.]